jgi:hypothetical protein
LIAENSGFERRGVFDRVTTNWAFRIIEQWLPPLRHDRAYQAKRLLIRGQSRFALALFQVVAGPHPVERAQTVMPIFFREHATRHAKFVIHL